MYNRYVPQPDGSFRRDWMPDAPPEPAPSAEPHSPQSKQPQRRPSNQARQTSNVGGFFRQLLPRDFCTEDLLVVLLLLLMSGDSKEDQNFALLTLALYLFL